MELPARSVVNIIGNTLNLIDPRLMDHGYRVAGLVSSALDAHGGYDEQQWRDVCMLALIHDIGAYKTDEIDRIAHFETVNVWQHSIYGYLFIKLLTPLTHLAPAVFFHHADCGQLRHLHPSYHDLAQILHIADRVDIMSTLRGGLDRGAFHRNFTAQREVKYRSDLVELFEEALFSERTRKKHTPNIFDSFSFTSAETICYLYMMVLSIDFRSPQTVTHTVGVMRIASRLAELMGLGGAERERVGLGALLHDIGKQGIPPEILESPDRLPPEQMEVMKTHVRLSEQILTGNIDDRVLRIAVRHHEKLNGSGYHHGLAARDLTPSERLVAVADVLSALLGRRSYKEPYPRNKVRAIMDAMVADKALDSDIVALARERHDDLAAVMDRTAAEAETTYALINAEYDEYLERSKHFGRGGLVLSQELTW